MRITGPYQLLRKIGSGGMAEVWSARRVNNVIGEKFVAIKILASHVADNPRYREMFTDEAKLSLTLNHANIVTVFDVVEHEGECYMVMELIEGMTLSQLARGLAKRGEKLPLPVVVYLIAELLRALAYAHELRTEAGSTIVHRDVSPQNVMVTTSGEVKLMDFGIARFSTEETSGNLVKGKLQYMPPEQLAKRTRAPTIDLFAVGGVFQELLEGQRFRGRLDLEVLMGMVIRGESPELTVEIPEQLDRLRLQLLEPDPSKRIASAKLALAQIYDWPGYRNTALALEELVCEFVEPSSSTRLPIADEDDDAAARSDAFSSGLSSSDVGKVPVVAVARRDESEADSVADALAAGASATDGGVSTFDLQTEAEIPSIVEAAYAEPSVDDFVVRSPNRRAAVMGGGVLALLVAIVAMVWGFGGDDEPEPEPTSEPVVIVAPKPVPEPGEQVAAATTDESGDSQTGEDTDEDEAADEDEDTDAASGRTKKKATHKVSVELVANEFFFVYVKIGSRTVTLEPKTSIKLPVGSHTVFLRQKTTEPWTRAGNITLRAGSSYRVEMKTPSGLRLIEK